MVRRPARASYALAGATLLSALYVFFIQVLGIGMWATGTDWSTRVTSTIGVLFVVQGSMVLLLLALLTLYLLEIFRNPEFVGARRRAAWVVGMAVLPNIAMPIYWWRYLRPRSEAFQRRYVT